MKQMEEFLPKFKQDTEQLINNPLLSKQKQVDKHLYDVR